MSRKKEFEKMGLFFLMVRVGQRGGSWMNNNDVFLLGRV